MYALDSEAYEHFLARRIPTANGTDNLNAWAVRLRWLLKSLICDRLYVR